MIWLLVCLVILHAPLAHNLLHETSNAYNVLIFMIQQCLHKSRGLFCQCRTSKCYLVLSTCSLNIWWCISSCNVGLKLFLELVCHPLSACGSIVYMYFESLFVKHFHTMVLTYSELILCKLTIFSFDLEIHCRVPSLSTAEHIFREF